MKRRKVLLSGAAAIAAPAITKFNVARAASTPDPSRLGADLTPLGGEKAASASLHIPEWTGGLQPAPPGSSLSVLPPDLFADETPSFTVTASNMAQYADMLSEGMQELLTRFGSAGFRVNVYPTHRTACAPQYVYDNTRANVTRIQPSDPGCIKGFTNANCGIPYPILSDDPAVAGAQAIWNHKLQWTGEYLHLTVMGYIVGSGQRILSSAEDFYSYYSYYNQSILAADFHGYFNYELVNYVAPPNRVGAKDLLQYSINNTKLPDSAFQYLVGVGRVRQAPSPEYDVPVEGEADAINYDEDDLFAGALDRFSWKLVGKKEMIVPYQTSKLLLAQPEDALGLQFVNPDLVRYEIHRCWVVEASVLPGARMTDAYRRFYIDEDTWVIMLSDLYDHQHNYWRCGQQFYIGVPNLPGVVFGGSAIYNFQSNEYVFTGSFYNAPSPLGGPPRYEPYPLTLFDPQSMTNSGGL